MISESLFSRGIYSKSLLMARCSHSQREKVCSPPFEITSLCVECVLSHMRKQVLSLSGCSNRELHFSFIKLLISFSTFKIEFFRRKRNTKWKTVKTMFKQNKDTTNKKDNKFFQCEL